MKFEPSRKSTPSEIQSGRKIRIDLDRRAEIGKERRKKRLLDILQRVVEYLATQPLQNATIEDIAIASGVSKRSFYNYFKNKEEIANAISILLEKVGEGTSNRRIDFDGTIIEEIAFGILSNLQFARNEPSLAKVGFYLYSSSYPGSPAFWTASDQFYKDRYAIGVRDKSFIAIGPKLHSEFVSTPLFSLASRIADEAANRQVTLMKSGARQALLAIGVAQQSATDAVNAVYPKLAANEKSVMEHAFRITVDTILGE